jgi:hypothetical protein
MRQCRTRLIERSARRERANLCRKPKSAAARTVWRLPNYQHLLRMLKNPTYAGAFAYGRTQCQTVVVEGRSRKRGGHRVAMENWQLLLKHHHPGYISWEQYLENQRILKSNRAEEANNSNAYQ